MSSVLLRSEACARRAVLHNNDACSRFWIDFQSRSFEQWTKVLTKTLLFSRIYSLDNQSICCYLLNPSIAHCHRHSIRQLWNEMLFASRRFQQSTLCSFAVCVTSVCAFECHSAFGWPLVSSSVRVTVTRPQTWKHSKMAFVNWHSCGKQT